MKSYSKPTSEQVDAAIPLLSSPQHEMYFFAHLENPHWIAPLAKRGVFTYPPKAQQVEGGGIRFPRWPPGRYLVRMASVAPQEVADIFAKMETDNASVIGDMLDAAMAMPTNISVSLVPAIQNAARQDALWIHFKDASDLCVRLAQGGEYDAAMKLAEVLFAPSFEEGRKEPRRRDRYWYKDGLREVISVLAGPCAHVLLPKLCDWLNVSIRKRMQRYGDRTSETDYSYVWRPAIEEHEQNKSYDFAGAMTGFVRAGFEQAIGSASISLDEALQIVGRYSFLMFKRLRIHLIGEFAEKNPRLAREVMLDRRLFEDYEYKHEYARLVGKRFSMLEPAEQMEWLGWVCDGPRGEEGEALDEPDDQDLTQRRRDYRRFQRLHWVRDHLAGENKRFYQEMLAKCGEPDMADLNVRVGPARWGSDSPMTVDELSRRTFEEAVNVVSSWRPQESRFDGPTLDGLGSTFAQYVATDPEQFSLGARALIGRHALFVRKFISQMADAVKDGQQIDLAAVLELCNWVVSRPSEERTTPVQEDEVLVDENWQWTREDISRFLENVCKAKNGEVPRYPMKEFRQPIWMLIENLVHDPTESNIVHDASEDDPRTHDYLDLGMNSPRGCAVWTGLEYARWVANHIKKLDGKEETVPDGFAAMPEVQKMLEWQIAPDNESREVMAVIGAHTSLIYWIDSQWLANNAHQLFNLDAIERAPAAGHGWAAWNAFLVWVRPHIEYYQILKAQFAYAVEQATKVRLPERSRDQPMYHLGEHLVLLYGRGSLGLGDDDGLLRRFVETSRPDIRRHAMGFIGESLEGDNEVPSEVIQRFVSLWDLYWAGPGKEDAAEEPNGFLFGLWFSCGRFPEQWVLDRFADYVRVVPTPEADHAIAKRLAEIAHVDVLASMQILDRIVRGDQEGWRIHGWLDSARDILRQAIRTPGDAMRLAMALIDYLGRRGYTDFGQLLREGTSSGSP